MAPTGDSLLQGTLREQLQHPCAHTCSITYAVIQLHPGLAQLMLGRSVYCAEAGPI